MEYFIKCEQCQKQLDPKNLGKTWRTTDAGLSLCNSCYENYIDFLEEQSKEVISVHQ